MCLLGRPYLYLQGSLYIKGKNLVGQMLQLAKRLKLSFVLCKLEREHLSCNWDLKEQDERVKG